MGILLTKNTNAMAINVSINCHTKKLRDCYILHTVLLATILVLIVIISCYYYAGYRSKQKSINELTI